MLFGLNFSISKIRALIFQQKRRLPKLTNTPCPTERNWTRRKDNKAGMTLCYLLHVHTARQERSRLQDIDLQLSHPVLKMKRNGSQQQNMARGKEAGFEKLNQNTGRITGGTEE